MTTKTKYSVGDKVRILNVDGISGGKINGYKTGDEAVLVGSFDDLAIPCKRFPDIHPLPLLESELAYIEKVDAKPTKNQRISALESQVSKLTAETADLQAQVARLQGVERVIKNVELQVSATADIGNVAKQLAEMVAGESVKPQPTPNELRKAIIAEARAFVAELSKIVGGPHERETRYGVLNNVGFTYVLKPEFHVNKKKRAVTVLMKGAWNDTGEIYAKAIAKCAPTDVFNADIGKAIALGRALGLDVSKFEQAVQPTEVVVGHTVISNFTKSIGGVAVKSDIENFSLGYARGGGFSILSDTEAAY